MYFLNIGKSLEIAVSYLSNDEFQFCNCRGYIKFNQSKLQRDIEQLRKDITRMTRMSNKNSVPAGEVNFFSPVGVIVS